MLNVIVKEYVQSVCKTKHSKLEESPVVGPHTLVEPANRSLSTADKWRGCSWKTSLYHACCI